MIGTILDDRYEILALVGCGRVGAVYQARHLLMNRLVAVKVLHAELAWSEDRRQRFQLEARALGSLSHPGIVHVHDFGFLPDGAQYLVMDYVTGTSLADRLKVEPALALPAVIAVISQCCAAFGYAHRKGILHRDIKPSNIMLVEEPDNACAVKIVDFGIARFYADTGSGQQMTGAAGFFASPFYMSPEQCLGRSLEARSDIYSLTCVLYQCITGQPPFAGATDAETLQMHLFQAPQPPASTICPVALTAIILKGLEKDQAMRFQSMDEMASALLAAGAQEQAVAVRAGSLSRFARIGSIVALCLVFIAALLSLIGLWTKTESGNLTVAPIRLACFEAGIMPNSPDLTYCLERAAKSLEDRNEIEQSKELYKRWIGALKIRDNPEGNLCFDAQIALADLLGRHGQLLECKNLTSNCVDELTRRAAAADKASDKSESLAICEKLIKLEKRFPDTYASDLPFLLRNAGKHCNTLMKYDQAIKYFNAALTSFKQSRGDFDPRVGETCHLLATVYANKNEAKMARALYERALDVESDDPRFADFDYLLPEYAYFLLKDSDFLRCEQVLKMWLSVRSSLSIDDPSRTYEPKLELGSLYFCQRKFSQSEQTLQEAIADIERASRFRPEKLTEARMQLANVLTEETKYSQAELIYRQLTADEGNPILNSDAYDKLSDLHRRQKHYQVAEGLDRQREALLLNKGLTGDKEYVNCLCRLGEDLDLLGKFDAADETFKQALPWAKRAGPEYAARCLSGLAEIYSAKKQYEQAESFLREAIGDVEQKSPSLNMLVAYLKTRLSVQYINDKKLEPAEESVGEALALLNGCAFATDKLYALTLKRQLAIKGKRLDEASKLGREIEQIQKLAKESPETGSK